MRTPGYKYDYLRARTYVIECERTDEKERRQSSGLDLLYLLRRNLTITFLLSQPLLEQWVALG